MDFNFVKLALLAAASVLFLGLGIWCVRVYFIAGKAESLVVGGGCLLGTGLLLGLFIWTLYHKKGTGNLKIGE